MVREFLEIYDVSGEYKQSFMNWAMEFLVWHISNMHVREIQKEYFYTFRKKWLPTVSFESYPPSYYREKSVYLKYILAKYVPYSIFSRIVSVYKLIKNLRKN